MRVIGTAGHVDHGKSTLVKTLTGINPDRWKEEQERQMTIDLGFAWMSLPNGETVGIVDVPGHEDFIENMLAGVGGIDAAILVIAVDEGVMPQTREHLAILNLLAIPRLVVALTKVDTLEDSEWRELVMLEIQEVLSETQYAEAPIVPVSAYTGEGLDHLIEAMMNLLDGLVPRTLNRIPRLPIDRVFTLSGFGTVVTGTLLDGNLQVGDTVEIQPLGKQARIRGLQSHQERVEVAVAGSRTAVNLSGIEKHELQRGQVLSLPNYIHPTQLIDVELVHLDDAARPLKHNTEVKVFVGTSEVIGQVRLLMEDLLPTGAVGWAQIQLNDPLPALRGQRFIVRLPSPAATIGGGIILDTAPGRKWKRKHEDVKARFERLTRATPIDLISEVLIQARRPVHFKEIMARTLLDEIDVEDEALIWREEWVIHAEVLQEFYDTITRLLTEFHETEPLQPGMHANTLRSQLRLETEPFEILMMLLLDAGIVAIQDNRFHLPNFSISYTRSQQEGIERIRRVFQDQPYTPPTVKETITEIGEPLLNALIRQRELVQVSPEVLLAAAVYQEWVEYARTELDQGHGLKVSEFRDRFGTTRKYALAFLEHLEALHLTRRVGDEHVLGRGDWAKVMNKS